MVDPAAAEEVRVVYPDVQGVAGRVGDGFACEVLFAIVVVAE